MRKIKKKKENSAEDNGFKKKVVKTSENYFEKIEKFQISLRNDIVRWEDNACIRI